ncbi:nitroreductase [Clostridium pasteurianum DSM 525 = ATCC 6013]|uniref:Nitroreductase n=1 Tax=Clostridium pasteurianum DSM 525 = ATCC 6013 TaxID=1262449 RepID=A0A0H3J506_CLOPA|nr:nitroreductase family protein [Clostridium pasteurianum]AJA49011.1 nitroreductase [Clostridium pasteurianum DSM 525 = ATCC 6013]AJA52999.1 nitroreductase [Clostridium pasteurianum DSM 525 = ATCC 6013]AOZ76217.1 nitroreductase [Clostridium pasteurianum DSM 525 = ATCC 6013]AOZ80013.1 nitroreductase [Clostridium pasteurianum]ELP60307.1 nitroreductase [Clostridium pasteurianum DSM 525 = ATCC 6013]
MDFLQLAKTRYSVRKYKDKKVEDEKLQKILEAGRVAPTGANTQPQKLIVITKEEGLKKLKKGANIYGAPVAVIVCEDHDVSWKRPYDNKDVAETDVAIVSTHLVLQATELGLGTIWVCYFDPKIIREEFNIPNNVEAVNIIGIGYADEEPASPERHKAARKPLEKTIIKESF